MVYTGEVRLGHRRCGEVGEGGGGDPQRGHGDHGRVHIRPTGVGKVGGARDKGSAGPPHEGRTLFQCEDEPRRRVGGAAPAEGPGAAQGRGQRWSRVGPSCDISWFVEKRQDWKRVVLVRPWIFELVRLTSYPSP